LFPFRQRKENAFFLCIRCWMDESLRVYLVLDRHSNKLRVQGGHVCVCDVVLKCDMTVWLNVVHFHFWWKLDQKVDTLHETYLPFLHECHM
jgi:hypothetical protein